MADMFLNVFGTPDDEMEQITPDIFLQDINNLIKRRDSMKQPELPVLRNTVAGVSCDVQAGDLPEEWPQVFKDLGAYILEMNDSLPDVFDRQLADLENWLKRMDQAVDMYWEPCDEGDPSVPQWYRQIADWADDNFCAVEPEAWQPYVFAHLYEDRTQSRQVRCKCEMMLDLWQSSWPDHFRNMLEVINRYKETKRATATV